MVRYVLELIVVGVVLYFGYTYECQGQAPDAALRYRAELTRASQQVWGLNAPIPVMAAQIHQESYWRPDVCSPYACGLTQFTPATAEWIQGKYGVEFGPKDRFNPKWAIRAMVRYNKYLYDRVGSDDCNNVWMALWGYNGGEGWRKRDQRLALDAGKNPLLAVEVEPFNAGRSKANFRENRQYPRRIIYMHQPKYALWGRMVCWTEGERNAYDVQ